MRRAIVVVLAALMLAATGQAASTQTRKAARKAAATRKAPAVRKAQARKPARKVPQTRETTRPADVTCPQVLGVGVNSRLQFCDVMTARTPAEGILIHLPPHKGVLTLSFDLHNRHTYSDQEVAAGKGYASYTATVAAVAPDSSILGRGVVRSEFRTARDLLDRVSGGAGPRGVKAVAPVGTERIRIEVPQEIDEVSLLGERLTVVHYDGSTESFSFTGPSRPIALISNVNVMYVPGKKVPAKAPARKKR